MTFPARRTKYNAKPTVLNGRRYDSQAEADYRAHLALLEAAGEVSDIVEQPRLELEPNIFFKPDFALTETHRSLRVWIDVKGVMTPRFNLICKLWALHGPGPLRIVKRQGRRSGWVTVREILPKARTVTCD